MSTPSQLTAPIMHWASAIPRGAQKVEDFANELVPDSLLHMLGLPADTPPPQTQPTDAGSDPSLLNRAASFVESHIPRRGFPKGK